MILIFCLRMARGHVDTSIGYKAWYQL